MVFSGPAAVGQSVGARPYEMVWANRLYDTRPPLIDFENLDGWSVRCDQAEAAFERSREQQLWGRYVGKLVYRGTGRQPRVTIRLAHPVAIAGPFDCINLWVFGNNWACTRRHKTGSPGPCGLHTPAQNR